MQINELSLHKSNTTSLDDFNKQITELKNSDLLKFKQLISKLYFQVPNTNIGIPASTIRHDTKKHTISISQWKDLIKNINKPLLYVEAKHGKAFQGKNYLYKYKIHNKFYGVGFCITKYGWLVTTFFEDQEPNIDNWLVGNGKAQPEMPTAAYVPGCSLSEGLNNIVIDKNKNVKRYIKKCNENYSTKTYYHGSNYKFTTFDKSKIRENKLGLCFNFTDDYNMAYQYGNNILKVHLDLNNPITTDDLDKPWTYEQDNLLAKKLGFPPVSKEDFDDTETLGDIYKIFKMKPEFIEVLEEIGYDGISFPEDHHFGVFEPEQIHIIDDVNESNEKLIPCIIQCKEMDGYGSGRTLEYRGIIRDKVKYKSQKDMELNWRPKRKSDLTLWNFLVYHKPNSPKIIDKDNNLDGWDIKYIPLESLNERFEEIERNVYATNSGYDIINRMKNKPQAYRMIWDNNIKYYFIGDAFDYIHQDILEHAYYNGFYPDMLSANECDDYMNKNMKTNDMVLFAFDPEGGGLMDTEKSSDGYTRKYVYNFGTIYAHEFTPFEKCPLYDLLGEPLKKENIFEDYIKIKRNKMTENLLSKLNKVMKPIKNQYWNEIIEDMGGMGAAPCPALGQTGTGSGCTVNGVPVEGQSVKEYNKKKKKSKKHEAIEPLFKPYQPTEEDKYFATEIKEVTPEEMIEEVEETFDPRNILVTTVSNNRETIKVSVQYDEPGYAMMHLLKLEYLDVDGETVLDETTEELALQDCVDELAFIFSTHDAIDGELYENTVDDNIENIINNLLNEDFNEAYERITDLIAKQLDKMNFEYANTNEIIYKKEGEYKYLFKFDNELGIIKIKVLKDEEVLIEKEWTLDEEDDVSPIFEEIEEIYGRYGL